MKHFTNFGNSDAVLYKNNPDEFEIRFTDGTRKTFKHKKHRMDRKAREACVLLEEVGTGIEWNYFSAAAPNGGILDSTITLYERSDWDLFKPE